MSNNVVRLNTIIHGQEIKLDADLVLDAAKGQGLQDVTIIGWLENGELWVSGSEGIPDTLFTLEKAKHFIVNGE